jgi:hypothetical protein
MKSLPRAQTTTALFGPTLHLSLQLCSSCGIVLGDVGMDGGTCGSGGDGGC